MYLRKAVLALGAICVSLGVTFGSSAQALDLSKARPHLTFNLASYHLNADQDFNEINPGLGIGLTFADGPLGGELGVEVGQYRNSLNSNSYYVTGSLDWEVAQVSDTVAVRLGGFGGMSHYPGDANKFKNRGVPTVGNWVLVAGAQATVRVNDIYDVRLRVLPAGKVADALFTMQVGVRF